MCQRIRCLCRKWNYRDEDVRFPRDCGVDAFGSGGHLWNRKIQKALAIKVEGAVLGHETKSKDLVTSKASGCTICKWCRCRLCRICVLWKSKRTCKLSKSKNYGKNPSGYKESCRDCFSDAAQIQILQQMKFDIIQMVERCQPRHFAVELVWYAINLSDPKRVCRKDKRFLICWKSYSRNYSTCRMEQHGGGLRWLAKTQTFPPDRGIFAGRKSVLAGGLHAEMWTKRIQLFNWMLWCQFRGGKWNGKDEALIKTLVACVKECKSKKKGKKDE